MNETSPEPKRSSTSNILLIIVLVILLAMLAVTVASALALRTGFNTVQSTADRIKQWEETIFKEPTPTVRPDPVTIIHQISALSRLETVSYSVEKVITAETSQQGIRDALGLDEKLLLVAHGQVIAGVDLGKLGPKDISLGDDNSVILTLPPAEIFITALDNERSYVYDHDRGILNRVFKEQSELETLARRAAEDEIEKAAIEDGILDLADKNARTYLHAFMLALGFDRVGFEG